MSLYRLMTASLACGFCGEEHVTTVQFRTGGEDNLESYDAGVPVSSDHGMAMETPFTAHADWYCPACLKQRKSDEVKGFYLALADLLAEKALDMEQPGFLFKKPVTPEMLRERAATESALMLSKPPKKYKHLFSRLEDYQTVWHDVPLEHGTPHYNEFIQFLNARIAGHMSQWGWLQSGLIRHDLQVILTLKNTLQLLITA